MLLNKFKDFLIGVLIYFGYNMQKHPDLMAADKFAIYTGPTMDVEGGRALNFCDLDQLFLD